jgi:hypothetical protein
MNQSKGTQWIPQCSHFLQAPPGCTGSPITWRLEFLRTRRSIRRNIDISVHRGSDIRVDRCCLRAIVPACRLRLAITRASTPCSRRFTVGARPSGSFCTRARPWGSMRPHFTASLRVSADQCRRHERGEMSEKRRPKRAGGEFALRRAAAPPLHEIEACIRGARRAIRSSLAATPRRRLPCRRRTAQRGLASSRDPHRSQVVLQAAARAAAGGRVEADRALSGGAGRCETARRATVGARGAQVSTPIIIQTINVIDAFYTTCTPSYTLMGR